MKKVLYLLVTLLFILTLVSCKKGKQITLSYDKNEIEIFVGEEVSVKPNVEVGKKVKNYELNYELSENIATIKDGKLTANEKGTVVVTVTTDQDKDAVASLKVVIKEKEIIPTEYKITLDADGGIVEKTEIKFIENEKVTLPQPSKEGYIFKGWYEGETKVETIENKNYALKALWEKEVVVYEIIYIAPGSKMPSEVTTEFTDGSKVTLPIPSKEGYIFKGWYEDGVLVETLENRLDLWNTISYKVKGAGETAFRDLPIGVIVLDNAYKVKWSNPIVQKMLMSGLKEKNLKEIANSKIYEFIKDIEEGKELPEEFVKRAIEMNATIDPDKWNEVTNEEDVENIFKPLIRKWMALQKEKQQRIFVFLADTIYLPPMKVQQEISRKKLENKLNKEYDVLIENNYPLPEDENEEKNMDLAEINAQVMSKKSYLKKWRGLSDEEADEELEQIKMEIDLFENSQMLPDTDIPSLDEGVEYDEDLNLDSGEKDKS